MSAPPSSPGTRAGRVSLARIPPELSAVLLAALIPLENLAVNADRVPPGEWIRPFGLIALGALVLAIGLGRLSGRRGLGAILAVFLSTLFWSAGSLSAIGLLLGVPSAWGPWVAAGTCGLVALLARPLGKRMSEDPASEGRIAGILAIAAVVFVAPATLRIARTLATPPPGLSYPDLGPPRPGPRPDLVFVLLDAYGRDDVLRQLYATDDAAFRGRLEGLGFQVAPAAFAEYLGTLQTMAATLNLAPFPDTSDLATRFPLEHRPLRGVMARPRFLELARRAGYRTRLIATGSDVWGYEVFDEVWEAGPRPFEQLLLGRSVLGEATPEVLHGMHRRRIHEAVARAAEAPAPDAPPTLTVVHLLAPHPPFVFAADGTPFRDRARFLSHDTRRLLDTLEGSGYYQQGYAAQVAYTGKLAGDLAEALTARRDREPLVWIFGDHGPRSLPEDAPPGEFVWERASILHAIRIPPGVPLDVPRPASLVRTARRLATSLFGVALPDLEPTVYSHVFANEYAFTPHPPAPRRGP